jgi:hypothetical protein
LTVVGKSGHGCSERSTTMRSRHFWSLFMRIWANLVAAFTIACSQPSGVARAVPAIGSTSITAVAAMSTRGFVDEE